MPEKGVLCQNRVFYACWDSLMSGPLGPLLLKSRRVWGWFIPKNFSRATFFVFCGTHLVDRYLSYLPVRQIWRKSAVWNCHARFQNRFDPIVERSWQENLFTSAASYVVIFHHFKVYMAVKLDFLPVIKWTCATIVTGTINKSCRRGAQRAKFAKKVHKPPLGVNVINFELNWFNASIWVPCNPSDPKKSWCSIQIHKKQVAFLHLF